MSGATGRRRRPDADTGGPVRNRRVVGLAGATAAVVVIASPLGGRSPWNPARLGGFVADADLVDLVAAVIRSAVLIAAVGLVTLLLVPARVGTARLGWVPRPVRRFLLAVGGLGATAPALLTATGVSATGADAPVAVSSVVMRVEPSGTPSLDVAEPVDTDTPADTDTPTVMRTDPLGPAPAPPPAPNPPPAPTTHVVRRGDHLWGIAAAHLADRLGRDAADAEITAYWRRLVDHNRSRLADPGNPDLIHPGQVVELPPVTPL